MAPDLDALQAFVAVAHNRSFSTAARRLHLTQPAISRRIARLERSAQVKLLDRDSHRVELTPDGRAMLTACERLLEQHAGLVGMLVALRASKA